MFDLFPRAATLYLVPMQISSVLVYVYFIVGNRLWITCSGEFHSTMRDYFFGKKKKKRQRPASVCRPLIASKLQ